MKRHDVKINLSNIQLLGKQKMNVKIILSFFAVMGVFIAKQYFDFSFIGFFIWIYFGFSLIWKISSRIAIAISFGFFISCFVLSIFNRNDLAEIMAVQTYFFLIIAVVLQIVAFKRGKNIDMRETIMTEDGAYQIIAINAKRDKIVTKLLDAIFVDKRTVNIKKNIVAYVLLLSFLLLEIAVVFFNWPLIVIIFWIIFAIAIIFPRNVIKFLFATGIFFCILFAVSIIFSQKDLVRTSYFGILFVFVFIVVIVGLRLSVKKVPNSPRKWVRSFSYLHKNRKSDD
jgi:hypothetical protein